MAFQGRNEAHRRETIRDLLSAGLEPRRIMEVTGYSRMQIWRVRTRLQNVQGMARVPGSGRPRQNSAIGTGHIEAVARQHGRWSSRTMARSLEEHFPEEAVSDRTVRRILHRDLDFKFGKLWRKFKLTEIHKLNRVVWSLLHVEDGWERTIFLDESCFALTPNGVRSWYPRGNRAPIFEAEQFPRKLHVLGAISSVGTVGPLVFAQPGQAWTVERVIAAVNDSILPMADAWFGEGNFRVQLDNATAPTANATVQFAQAAGVDLLFQSANSPDLQPIENVWGLLKNNISRRDDIVTTNDLRQALEEESARLGAEQTTPLVESMPDRLTDCLAAGGGHTHY